MRSPRFKITLSCVILDAENGALAHLAEFHDLEGGRNRSACSSASAAHALKMLLEHGWVQERLNLEVIEEFKSTNL